MPCVAHATHRATRPRWIIVVLIVSSGYGGVDAVRQLAGTINDDGTAYPTALREDWLA